MVKIHFIEEKDGKEIVVDGVIGLSLLEIAHRNNIRLEGACGGSLACSTCHLIIADLATYDALPSPTDAEEDMLDLALGLKKTSRLGCQIIVTEALDGLKAIVPKNSRNILIEDD